MLMKFGRPAAFTETNVSEHSIHDLTGSESVHLLTPIIQDRVDRMFAEAFAEMKTGSPAFKFTGCGWQAALKLG